MPAIIRKIVRVEDHPNPGKPQLGVFTLSNGAVCIGVNPSVGVRRFKVGDLCVHVEPGSVIPMRLMDNGFENLKPKGKVKASNFAGVRSEGIMLDVSISKNNEVEWYYVDIQGEHQRYVIAEADNREDANNRALDFNVSIAIGVT